MDCAWRSLLEVSYLMEMHEYEHSPGWLDDSEREILHAQNLDALPEPDCRD